MGPIKAGIGIVQAQGDTNVPKKVKDLVEDLEAKLPNLPPEGKAAMAQKITNIESCRQDTTVNKLPLELRTEYTTSQSYQNVYFASPMQLIPPISLALPYYEQAASSAANAPRSSGRITSRSMRLSRTSFHTETKSQRTFGKLPSNGGASLKRTSQP